MESTTKNVLIIIPYFGTTPVWIDYFIKSCSLNVDFHWLIYGNLIIPGTIPANVSFVKAELEDFNRLASNKLNFPVRIIHPYKLCDFKITYGVIFEDFISDYDYWGYGDLDLIYGQISTFLPVETIKNFDVVTTRKNYYSGHFTLYKNCDKLKYSFTNIWNYKNNLMDFAHHYSLTERSNYIGQPITCLNSKSSFFAAKIIKKIYRSLKYRIFKRLPLVHDMTILLNSLEKNGEIQVLKMEKIISDWIFEKSGIKSWEIIWKNGKLIYMCNNSQYMYFHFIYSKTLKDFNIVPYRNQEYFIINNTGFQ
jgi:hypothetical protein